MHVAGRHPGSNRDSHVTGWWGPAAAAALAGLAVTGHAADADACGACYASSSESTVVNDHRMAFSIGKQQTILSDSISYSGNPQEFAYVLPAKPGTRLEPSNEAWFTALDLSTRPIIMGPQQSGGGPGKFDWEDRGGCCSSTSDSMALMADGANAGGRGGVAVVDQAVVGPYETVTVRSTDPDALERWLREHDYAIPPSSGPIIASYVKEGFDFIAMRLQPGKDVRAMEPVRIVSPGTDTSLPLRLMQIGAGATVGITLYVIGEGRYRTASFPDVPIDFSKLFWDGVQNRSNYQELSKATMATENGRAFITEYADRPSFEPNAVGASGMTSNTGLLAAYKQACATYGQKRPLPEAGDPPKDAQPDSEPVDAADPDAGDVDGGDVDGGDVDAGEDAAVANGGDAGAPPRVVATYCDDLDVAIEGMARSDVWVTRLRANLPNAALADTLRLEPSPKQERQENIHQTVQAGTIPPAQIARMRAAREHGTYALVALTAFVLSRVLRSKRRRSDGAGRSERPDEERSDEERS